MALIANQLRWAAGGKINGDADYTQCHIITCMQEFGNFNCLNLEVSVAQGVAKLGVIASIKSVPMQRKCLD